MTSLLKYWVKKINESSALPSDMERVSNVPDWAVYYMMYNEESEDMTPEDIEMVDAWMDENGYGDLVSVESEDGFSRYPVFGKACNTVTAIFSKKNISEDIIMDFDELSIKAPEKRKLINAIYRYLDKTKTTKKFYSDETWEGPSLVKQDIETALKPFKERMFEVSVFPDDRGGYRTSADGHNKWKQYRVAIFEKGKELPFMGGFLNCHAAGTVDNPFSRYDMSLQLGW